MIVLDIEASGIDTGRCGIWQIGSIDLENPENYFLEEGRIDSDDEIMEEALKLIEKTKEDLLDKNKQSQRELILKWLKWVGSCKEKLFTGQNVGWDLSFIQNRCMRYDIMDEFRKFAGQRGMDLQTIAQMRYNKIHGKYLLKEDGRSDMNLKSVLDLCGIPDKRKQVSGGEVSEEGAPHNALEDCKLEGECYSRLEYGKNLFPEYSQFEIPEELRK